MSDKEFQAEMVKNEMKDKGFTAIQYGDKVEVSLSSRKVNVTEVEYVLSQEFDGIQFNIKNTWNGVLVTV